MAKTFSKSISLLTTLTLAAPVFTSAAPSLLKAKGAVVSQSGLYGLERINIDSWTQLMSKGREQGINVLDLRSSLSTLLIGVKTKNQLFNGIRQQISESRLQTVEDYRDLGKMLLELRQEMRQQKLMSRVSLQDSLYLLELMGEETLYVGSKRFKNFPTELSIAGNPTASERTAMIREFPVQTGDVVLSKATGAGSSSFIALSMDQPHIFSHSTPVYLDGQSNVISPEAEIEDGVKLRNMKKDYIDGSKTRMYIYRYQGQDASAPNKIIDGVSKLVAEMYQRTGGDPFNIAAYKYDFSMTPGEVDTRGLFCSSVAYEAYLRGGLIGHANPYTEAVWSPVSKVREVLLKSLNMNTGKVPAPGDLELNPEFKLVGARIDISKLHQDRVEMAIIDTLMSELEKNKQSLESLTRNLDTLGSKSLDKKAIEAFLASGMIPKELAQKIRLLDKIPDSINIKQLAFFGLLNDVLTKKVRPILLAQIADLEQQGKLVGPLELRAMALKQSAMVRSEISSFQDKIAAVTGVVMCSKIF